MPDPSKRTPDDQALEIRIRCGLMHVPPLKWIESFEPPDYRIRSAKCQSVLYTLVPVQNLQRSATLFSLVVSCRQFRIGSRQDGKE